MTRILLSGGVLAAIVGALVAWLLPAKEPFHSKRVYVAVEMNVDRMAFRAGEPLFVISTLTLENTGLVSLMAFNLGVDFLPKESAAFARNSPVVNTVPGSLQSTMRSGVNRPTRATFEFGELIPKARVVLIFNTSQSTDLRVSSVAEGFYQEKTFKAPDLVEGG